MLNTEINYTGEHEADEAGENTVKAARGCSCGCGAGSSAWCQGSV